MTMEKHARLIDRLIELTKGGSIDWKPSIDQDEFQISFKDNTVRLRQVTTQENVTYYVDLINADGTTVETFHDGQLDQDAGFSINSEWFHKMEELYELARRNAFGADKVLDSILSDLDDIMPF